MNRLERLINLVAGLLAADRPLTREEIFERVPGYEGTAESARRAFERDKEALRSMGVPFAMETIRTRAGDEAPGYRIRREQYELPDPDLEPDELSALHVALATVRLEGAGDEASAIWKLGGDTGGEGTGDEARVELPGSEHLPVLFEAATLRASVQFRYRGEDRTVDPYRVAFRGGRWYLSGFDHARSAERSFRLDRFDTAPAAGEAGAFERPPTGPRAPAKPWEMGDEEPVEALLLVDADQAAWVEGEVGPDRVRERRGDGAVVVALTVTNREAFRGFVVSLLERAEVLSPAELRADIVAWLEAMAA